MENVEMNEQPAPAAAAPSARSARAVAAYARDEAAPCPTCTAAAPAQPSFVYALGRIEPRFPRLSVEKEFAQVARQTITTGLTDRQVLHAVLSQPENRYLVRQLCWVMTIAGIETYILVPRDPLDVRLLVDAVRPRPHSNDLDAVIGVRSGLAPPEMCNGLVLPVVLFDQIYSFDRDSLLKALPRPEKRPAEEFTASAAELLDRLILMTDNAGATDDHRALNYLAVRYPAIYAAAAEMHARDCTLTAVDVRPWALSPLRRIVEVIFSYTNRKTDVVEQSSCLVDAHEMYLFMHRPLQPCAPLSRFHTR